MKVFLALLVPPVLQVALARALRLSKDKMAGMLVWPLLLKQLSARMGTLVLVVVLSVIKVDTTDLGRFLHLMLVLVTVAAIILSMDGKVLVALVQQQLLLFAAPLVLLALKETTMVATMFLAPLKADNLLLLLLLLPCKILDA